MLSRRKFLGLSTLILGALGIGNWLLQPNAEEKHLWLYGKLQKLYNRHPSTSHIAEAYTKSYPAENNLQLLLEKVFADGSWPYPFVSQRGVRKYIRKRSQRDFELNDTVKIDDWLLSRTEVRLCAISILLSTRI